MIGMHRRQHPFVAGLGPAIHEILAAGLAFSWIPGPSPGKTIVLRVWI